jgi:hypothetical protein
VVVVIGDVVVVVGGGGGDDDDVVVNVAVDVGVEGPVGLSKACDSGQAAEESDGCFLVSLTDFLFLFGNEEGNGTVETVAMVVLMLLGFARQMEAYQWLNSYWSRRLGNNQESGRSAGQC